MSSALHVETVGAGLPLVMLHGWAMHGGAWGPLLPRLAAHHRVHVVDLPGHGHSRATGAFALDPLVASLDAHFADAPAPLTVLGWSLGAMLALHWAHRASGRIGRLILLGATARFVADESWPHAMQAATLARFGDELGVAYQATLQRFLSLQLSGSDHARATLAAMRRQLFARGEPSADTLHAALALLRDADLRPEIATITQPVLVIAGGRDLLTPIAASQWLARSLPCARLVELPDAGHVPFLSHPDAVMAAIDAFEHEY